MKINDYNNINYMNHQMNKINLFNNGNNNMNNMNLNNINNFNSMNNMYMNMNQMNNMNFNNINNINNFNNMNNFNNNMNINNMNNFNNENVINFNGLNNSALNNDIYMNSKNNIYSNNSINTNNNNINNKKINNPFFQSFNFFKTLNFFEKIQNCICKVCLYNRINPVMNCNYNNNLLGYCFRISKENKKYKVLLTQVESTIDKYDSITYDFFNKNNAEPFMMDRNLDVNDRQIVSYKINNIIICEIKPYEIQNYHCFDLNFDNKGENSNSEKIEENGNLLILISINRQNYSTIFSFGILEEINEKEIKIKFNYDKGFLGSPIINISNRKIIGILTSSEKGIPIETYLKEYILNYNSSLNKVNYNKTILNQINIKVEIKKDDRNYRVKFINHLENLNKNEIHIYLENHELNFQDYFIPGSVEREGIYNITLVFKEKVKNCFEMFRNCDNIIEIDLSCFDTKNVTDMSYMFSECQNLKYLDLSNFDTKNVTNMSFMFYQCGIKELDLSNFNNENVTNMSQMFAQSSLKKLNVSSFNTKNVKDMSHMFSYNGLKHLDLSSFIFDKNCDLINIIGGTPLKTITIRKNKDVENYLNIFLRYINGTIITI